MWYYFKKYFYSNEEFQPLITTNEKTEIKNENTVVNIKKKLEERQFEKNIIEQKLEENKKKLQENKNELQELGKQQLYPERTKKYTEMSIKIIQQYNWDNIIDFCEKLNVTDLIIPFNFLVSINSNFIRYVVNLNISVLDSYSEIFYHSNNLILDNILMYFKDLFKEKDISILCCRLSETFYISFNSPEKKFSIREKCDKNQKLDFHKDLKLNFNSIPVNITEKM
jgi:hypothetical protein